MIVVKVTALPIIIKGKKNGKCCRPIQSGMMFYGYSYRTVPTMSRLSGFILLKYLIVRGNIASINHSMEIQK